MSLLQFILNSNSGGRSEQLTIVGLTYPNEQGYQTQPLMIAGMGNYQWSPLVWTILDKTFISVTGSESPSHYYLYIIDHFTGKVSNAIDTGLLCETALDVHHIAAIIGTDNLELLITETSFHGGGGNWKHSKTPINYDVLNFPAWADSGVNENTYHQLKVMSSGDIYDVQRLANISLNYAYIELYKSTDNGTSFTKVTRILDWGIQPDDNRYIPYPALIFSDDDVVHLIVNSMDRTWTGVSTFIGGPRTHYLLSRDGCMTWENVDNSFSKDVNATAPLTLAEMNANMIAWDLGTATDIIRANGFAIVDGNPYVIGGSGDVNNSPLALYYWNGSAWVQKVITCAGHTIQPAFDNRAGFNNNSTGLFKNGSSIDLICTELVAGNVQLSKFRTADNGTTWIFIEQYTSNAATHRNAHINKNLDISEFKAVACVVDNGDSTDRLFLKEI